MKISKSYSILALILIIIPFLGIRSFWKFSLVIIVALGIIYLSIEWPKKTGKDIKREEGKRIEEEKLNPDNYEASQDEY